MQAPFYYVSIAGVLGVGKTTACNLLAKKLDFHIFGEKVKENNFLPLYYKDAPRWAFHTQMFYLHEKGAQLKEIKNLLATTHVVQDVPIHQDRHTYAEAQRRLGNMTNDEFALYEKSFEELRLNLPEPHLIVNLEASPGAILERVRSRGRDYEKGITMDYIKLLSELQREWTMGHRHPNILTVDMNVFDLVNNKTHQEEFVAKVGNRLGISSPVLV